MMSLATRLLSVILTCRVSPGRVGRGATARGSHPRFEDSFVVDVVIGGLARGYKMYKETRANVMKRTACTGQQQQ